MRMKKRVVFVNIILYSVFVILSSNLIYADCDDTQTIMKLSSQTNAHGALWNDLLYSYKICYNEIFGIEYPADINVHQCNPNAYNPTNHVLYLTGITNAHAKFDRMVAYETGVCYGDLVCRQTTSDCNANEALILRLYQEMNSHISYHGDIRFSYKICCSSANAVRILNSQWRNMKDIEITTAEVNDTVKLYVSGTNPEENIEFTIYKDNRWWWDTEITTLTSSVFTTWNATEVGTYYFKANIQGSPTQFRSGDLEVTATEKNSPPVANITSPKIGSVYFVNENVDFNQASYDEDDHYYYNWSWETNSANGSTRNFQNYNITRSFNTPGQKTIRLDVKDERGLTDSDGTSISVIKCDGPPRYYVYADIFYPDFNQEVSENPVIFNATSSYVISCTQEFDGTIHIKCEAGNCPKTTANGQTITNLVNPNKKFDDLKFSWIFNESIINSITTDTKTGLAGAIYSKSFMTSSTPFKPHNANLTVNFSDDTNKISITSNILREFYFYPVNPLCLQYPLDSFWSNKNGLQDSKSNCNINGVNCCPINGLTFCNTTSKKCEEGLSGCSAIKESCNGNSNIANQDDSLKNILKNNQKLNNDPDFCGETQNFRDNCVYTIKCKCNSISGICGGQHTYHYCNKNNLDDCWLEDEAETRCTGGTDDPVKGTGTCQFYDFNTIDKCDTTGFYEISHKIESSGVSCLNDDDCKEDSYCYNGKCTLDYCKAGTENVPCISVTMLPFFDFTNFIIVIMIVIIYYLTNRNWKFYK